MAAWSLKSVQGFKNPLSRAGSKSFVSSTGGLTAVASLFLAWSINGFSQDCRPTGRAMRSIAEWRAACERCGGRVLPGPRCVFDSAPSTPTSPDTYQQEEERRRMEAERERERQEQAAREEADKKKKQQEEFEKRRSEAVSSLKGVGATAPALKGAEPNIGGNTPFFGLKGVTRDEGRRETGPALGGPSQSVDTAWKQLHCAASILGHGYAAQGRGDLVEFKFLAEEALKALSGNAIRVQCPASTPDMPRIVGATAEHVDRMAESQRKLIERSVELADRIARVREEGQSLERFREEQRRINRENLERYSEVRAQQRRINEANERRDAQERARQRDVNQRQEEAAKKELERLAETNRKLVEGEPVELQEAPSRRRVRK